MCNFVMLYCNCNFIWLFLILQQIVHLWKFLSQDTKYERIYNDLICLSLKIF